MMRRRLIGAALVALLVVACAPVPERAAPVAATPAGVPEALAAAYAHLAASGQAVYDVDPARSVVIVEVRRGGTLANLGHDHVVASHDVRGYVAPGVGTADVWMRVADLSIDEPALRDAAGFDTHPSAADITGTQRNMLTRVLQPDTHPYVVAHVSGARADALTQALRPTLTVNGVDHVADAETRVEASGAQVRVSGRTTIRQSDFGIRPFSILAGALQVDDALTVRFDVVAHRR